MFTALSTIVGVGLQAFGLYQNNQAQQKQQAAAQQQALIQQQINNFQQQNVALQQQAAAIRFADTFTQIEYNKKVIAEQGKIEDIREQAVLLDAQRKRNEEVRKLIVQQAYARSTANSQGASRTDSSIYGAMSQLANRSYSNILGVENAKQAAQDAFALNRNITSLQLEAQSSNQGFLRQIVDLEQQARTQQANVYALGGQANAVSQQSAVAQGQASLASGLYQAGGVIASPSFQQSASNIYNTLFPSTQVASNQGYSVIGGGASV